MDSASTFVVDTLLQQARNFPSLRDQGRKLIEYEDRPVGSRLPETLEQRVPLRIAHSLEAWDQTSNLLGEGRPLEGRLPIVANVENRPLRRKNLPEQPGLAAPASAVENP